MESVRSIGTKSLMGSFINEIQDPSDKNEGQAGHEYLECKYANDPEHL